MSIKRGDVGGTGDGTLNTIDQIVAQVAAEIRLRTAEAKLDANRAEAAAVDALEYRDQTEQLKNQAEDRATMADQAAISALDSSVQAGISRAEAEAKAIEAAASADEAETWANEAAASVVAAENFALQAADEADLALQYKNDAAQSAATAQQIADELDLGTIGGRLRGIPFPFPGEVPPPGAIAYNGAELLRADFPELWAWAQTYAVVVTDAEWQTDRWGLFSSGDGATTFRVPDLRGEFVRGWDNGRGVDAGRIVGVHQMDALQNITGSFNQGGHSPSGSGAFYTGNKSNSNSGLASDARIIHFDASRVARTADETRPRNIAYLMCAFY